MRPSATAQGQAGEALAEAYLIQQGLVPVARNFRTSLGEIDLIMQQGPHLVFVEVKQRKHCAFGHPAETVTPRKQQKILQAALAYLQQHASTPLPPVRFDVVAIVAPSGAAPRCHWIANAFTGE